MFPISQCVLLTRGVGAHRHRLTPFEYAPRDADIEQQNLPVAREALRRFSPAKSLSLRARAETGSP